MKTAIALILGLLALNASATPYYRLWRGHKLASLTQEQFEQGLNQKLIPQTVVVGQGKGLVGYLPAIIPGDEVVPHEIALVIYSSEEAYKAIRSTPEGQAYGELHWEFFEKSKSGSAVPIPFNGSVESGKAYYLFGGDHDWQKGSVTYAVAKKVGDMAGYMKLMKDKGPRFNLLETLILVTDTHVVEFNLWRTRMDTMLGRAVIWGGHAMEHHPREQYMEEIPMAGRAIYPADWRDPQLKFGDGINVQF